MHDLTCPRCGEKFQAAAKIVGLVCLPCLTAADDWQDFAPTQPRGPLPRLKALRPE